MVAWIVVGILVFLLIFLVLFYRAKWQNALKEIELEQLKLAEQKKWFEQVQSLNKQSFESVASEVLDKNSERFLKLAIDKLEKSNMEASFAFDKKSKEFGDMVKPIKELLGKMDGDIQQVEKLRGEQFGQLSESLRQVNELNEKLRLETSTLSSALKRPEVRGSWGEIQLRRVVELAGMSAYCDFDEQVSQKSETGALQKPDLLVYMPNKRSIIVDAKAVMDAYLDAMEEKNADQRKVYLNKHAQNLRSRVRDLAKKSYWEQFESSPEFVVLFVPNEALLAAAVEVDRNLIEDALKESVIIATPTTLVSLLKAIAYGWQQDQVQENAKQIVSNAKDFYQRLLPWLKKLEDMGAKLDGAVKSYNEGVGSLESRVLPSVRRMRTMAFPDKEPAQELKPVDKSVRQPQKQEEIESN